MHRKNSDWLGTRFMVLSMALLLVLLGVSSCKRLMGFKTPKAQTEAEIADFYERFNVSPADVRLQSPSFYNVFHRDDSIFYLGHQFKAICEKSTSVRLPMTQANQVFVYDSLGRWLHFPTGNFCVPASHLVAENYLRDPSTVICDTLDPKVGTLKVLNQHFLPLAEAKNPSFPAAHLYIVITDGMYMPKFTRREFTYFNGLCTQYPGQIHVMHYNMDLRPGFEESIRKIAGLSPKP